MGKVILLVLCFYTIVGCSHRDISYSPAISSYGGLSIIINHSVNNQLLLWDSIKYHNEAGNVYSISKLQYYISNIRLYKNNNIVQQNDSAYYIDAKHQYSSVMLIPTLLAGVYDSVALTIGLLPFQNISYGLPTTIENTNMGWPDAMGGGYHFLKLEGHWKDAAVVNGFALHVGKSGFHCEAGFACNLDVRANQITNLNIMMNINEWFRKPAEYDFSSDGVYSMGNEVLMRKIIVNGQDVFSQIH